METRPFISIIIPTYNRPQPLAACLESLTHLAYPRQRWEVIVVNDGGCAPPLTVDLPHLHVLTQANAGPAAARNRGAAQAQGDLLAFLDDDCRPHPHWLDKLAARLAADPDCLAGGQTLNALPRNPYASASQLLIDYLYVYYNRAPAGPAFFTSNNFALSRDSFRAMGGFDVTFPLAAGEDREFCHRWRRRGGRLAYEPAALVYHAHHLTLRSFARQHFQYGRGAYHFHHRRQERVAVEPLPFYTNLVLFPFARAGLSVRSLGLAGLLAGSQLANAAGFFYQSRQQ